MGNGKLVVAALGALLWCAALSAADQPAQVAGKPAEPAWREIELRGQKFYVMPEEVAKGLGLPRRDIPDDKNAATVYLQACQQWIDRPEMEIEQEERLRREPWQEKDFPAVADWLTKNREGFELLHKAAALEQCQWPLLSWRPGDTFLFESMLPYLPQLREFARCLAIRGHFLEGQGKAAEALQDYLAAVRMVSLLGQEGDFLITGLVGLAVEEMGLKAMEGCVLRGKLDAKALRELLGALLAVAAAFPDPAFGLEAEAAAARQFVDRVVTGSWEDLPIGGEPFHGNPAVLAFMRGRAWRVIVPDRTMKRDLDPGYRRMAGHARMPAWQRQGGDDPLLLLGLRPWNFVAQVVLPALDPAADRHAVGRAQLAGVTQLVALQLHRLEKGKYPERLEELLGAHLPELPLDPFTGRPFVYRQVGDRFLLYSFGMDRRDDGGVPRELAGDGENYDLVFGIEKR